MGARSILGYKELATEDFWKAVLAEAVASFLYIVTVCGAGFHVPGYLPPGVLQIALTVGITVAVLASTFWNISGGHFNPAVTIGLAAIGKVPLVRCVLYIVAQCVGSTAGTGLLFATIPKDLRGNIGALSILESVGPKFGFIIEVIMTFQFIMAVVASTDPQRGFVGFQAPLAIGFSVSIGLLMAVPITGGCLNPIRAFGPGVVANKLDNHWVYWVGPIIGSVLASCTYKYLFTKSWKESKSSLTKKIVRMQQKTYQINVDDIKDHNENEIPEVQLKNSESSFDNKSFENSKEEV